MNKFKKFRAIAHLLQWINSDKYLNFFLILSENLLGIFRYMWNSTGVEKSEYIGNLKILKYRILLFITTYYCPFFIPQGAIAFIITIFKDR